MSGNTATDKERPTSTAVGIQQLPPAQSVGKNSTLSSKRVADSEFDLTGGQQNKRARILSSKERAHVSSESRGGQSSIDSSRVSEGQVNNIAPTVSQQNVKMKVDSSGNSISQRFSNIDIDTLFVLEICAGSARLTKAAREQGFKGLAFDHSDARSCGIEICNIDLTDPQQLQDLLEFITVEAPRIVAIWIAPSCGTASRARERPLPGNVDGPKPLRSSSQPDHIDGLHGVDKLKVEKANQLYDAVEIIAFHAHSLDICVGIENPANSHFWNTTPMKAVTEQLGGNMVTFHNCAHGGRRDKLTSVWQSHHAFDSLELYCDRKHSHDPWRPYVRKGQMHFPTSEEAAYPVLLCERIVACIKTYALQRGATTSETLQQEILQQCNVAHKRIALGALPRGQRVKPLVHEFSSYAKFFLNPQNPHQAEKKLAQYPKGARITHRQLLKGDVVRGSGDFTDLDDSDKNVLSACDSIEVCTVGVPGEPMEFLAKAVEAGHPRGLDLHVDGDIDEVTKENFHRPPHLLAKKRIAFFHRWSARAKELADAERELLDKAPDHVAKIMTGKRLVLWGEILQSLGYPDSSLIKEMAEGFRLTGWMTKSNMFPKGAKRPAFGKETMLKLAKGLNRATLQSLSRRQDPELEQGTWNETLAEVEHGWIWEDVRRECHDIVIAKRFGLQQREKLRVIDDCSCGGLNQAVGLSEKFQLHSIDQMASMLAHSLTLSGDNKHPLLQGRTYDLKSAYKQFAIHPDDRAVLRLAVNQPGHDSPVLFGVNALPFGAVGSVSAFLRVSLSIWYIGLKGLGLFWTAFYDDFSVVSRDELVNSAAHSCEMLFKLLGVSFAETGKKATQFDRVFRMLGLVVDMSDLHSGSVSISHTDERRRELIERIDEVLKSNSLTRKEAERLKGRMVFFEGYTFGRVANEAIKQLGRHITQGNHTGKLDASLRRCLHFLASRVLQAGPIKVQRCLNDTWIVFTDGACSPEEGSGSVGGVLISPYGDVLEFFSEKAPKDLAVRFFRDSKNPIHELEIVPVLMALQVWCKRLQRSQTVWYIDNESARMAYIRGTGETSLASAFFSEFVTCEADHQLRSWFARVPSYSNLADGASRMDDKELTSLGAVRTTFEWESIRCLC